MSVYSPAVFITITNNSFTRFAFGYTHTGHRRIQGRQTLKIMVRRNPNSTATIKLSGGYEGGGVDILNYKKS